MFRTLKEKEIIIIVRPKSMIKGRLPLTLDGFEEEVGGIVHQVLVQLES